MRALLYADWIVIRKTFLRYLLFSLLIVTPIIVMSSGSEEFAPGTSAACISITMVSFYLAIGLFSADETNDWEQVRLTLPTSARQVVRSRYAFSALTLAAMVVLGTIIGVAVEWLIPILHGVLTVPRGFTIIGLSSVGVSLGLMLFLAIEMPIIFWKGITKARMAFSLPMLLPLLLTIDPVRDTVLMLADKLGSLANAMGSPAPLFAGAAVLICLLYLASMRLSEQLYAARDF